MESKPIKKPTPEEVDTDATVGAGEPIISDLRQKFAPKLGERTLRQVIEDRNR